MASEGGERRLAAVMFTDMVGYTALGQRDESLSLALLEEQRKLVRPILSRHRGREVKTIGDAFLVEFSSALDAARCAYDVQRATREFNLALPAEKRIHLRIGIHVGEIVLQGGDIAGDAVNVASRIEGLAEDGGVCLTEQVYDHVQNKLDLPLQKIQTRPLKNVSARFDVYRMVMPWESKKESSDDLFDRKRIAVLPLVNISPNQDDAYFADGMTEELISTMSRISGLKVIARTSVMQYKASGKKISEVASELKVGSVLEGSVRKVGDKARITVQLIDSSSSEHLWTESYDRELKDILAVQSDISTTVAESLKVKLLSGEKAMFEKTRTVDPSAYALYLKGRYLWNERTRDSVLKSKECFEQAMKIDPEMALAYSGLADCYSALANYSWMVPADSLPLAKQFAARALEIDEGLAEAHASLGFTLAELHWDLRGAEIEMERAIELRPNYAYAFHLFALLLTYLRRYEEALEKERKAVELDPYSRVPNMGLGIVLAAVGNYAGALAQFDSLLARNPEFGSARFWKSTIHLYLGEKETAVEEARRALGNEDDSFLKLNLAWICAETGRKDEARKILQDILGRKREDYGRPTMVALVLLSLDDADEGFRWLRRALDEKDSALLITSGLPWLKGYLEKYPGWSDIGSELDAIISRQ